MLKELNMEETKNLIQTFYTAFQQRDYATMNACYADDVTFSDPVFTFLQGKRAKAMWHMLCERGEDLQVTFRDIQANETSGSAHWEATYTFSTGRRVLNVIEAEFQFQNGKIIAHQDTFDLWRWTRMALGMSGVLLGWSLVVKNKVRATAVKSLDAFIAKHPEYQE